MPQTTYYSFLFYRFSGSASRAFLISISAELKSPNLIDDCARLYKAFTFWNSISNTCDQKQYEQVIHNIFDRNISKILRA